MKISIIIPTFKNFAYLKFCIDSIIKNSKFDHEIIVHINGEDNLTEDYLSKKKLLYTKSKENIGLILVKFCIKKIYSKLYNVFT